MFLINIKDDTHVRYCNRNYNFIIVILPVFLCKRITHILYIVLTFHTGFIYCKVIFHCTLLQYKCISSSALNTQLLSAFNFTLQLFVI